VTPAPITRAHDTLKFNGHDITTAVIKGKPWFVASDVAKVLGIQSNLTAALSRLLPEDHMMAAIPVAGQVRHVRAVSETGLYDLIIESRRPAAREFRRWVTSKVLPSVVSEGAYVSPDATGEEVARYTEKLAFDEIRSMLARSSDYDSYPPGHEPSNSVIIREAFRTLQREFFFAVTGMTTDAIRATRSIRSWKGKNGPTSADRSVAKNYLTPSELARFSALSKIVAGVLQLRLAELQDPDNAFPVQYTMSQFNEMVKAALSAYAVSSGSNPLLRGASV
jgi:prophage antirepressor-like protein